MNNNKIIPRNPKWNGRNGKNGKKAAGDLETKKISDVAIEAPTRIINPSRPQITYFPRLLDSWSVIFYSPLVSIADIIYLLVSL
jgi:hypothetical protein